MRLLITSLLAVLLVFSSQAQESATPTTPGRLASVVEFTLRVGTNRPISAATAKAFGLGNETLPAVQAGFLPPGETQVRLFAVSSRNTNDLFVGLIDKVTRSGKFWLTSPEGDIRVTLQISSNAPPQVVPDTAHADEFISVVSSWLQLAAPVETNSRPLSGDGESLGTDDGDGSGTVREISDLFGREQLQALYARLNSAAFQAPLTNYSCGDPVPKLKFTVSLRPAGFATTRAVEIYYSPGFSPGGRTRGLMFGVDYLLDKAVAALDPEPKQETTREPHCDCSKRDGNEEWVTFPGPDEILAPKKVAAKIAAQRADAAAEEQLANLDVIHLDPADVQIQPHPDQEHLVTREQLLGQLPPAAEMGLFTVDPTFHHWAYVMKRGNKQVVVLDGVEGPAYDEIPDHQQLEFSADGKRFAYVAKHANKMFVVADGREGKAYDEVEEMFHPIFSPDGKHLAYIASKNMLGFLPPKTFAVLDGVEQKSYELVEDLQFSADSKHLAYDADIKWNRQAVVVLDGKESKIYAGLSSKAFSPDGNQLAFIAHRLSEKNPEQDTGTDRVVVNGREEKPYQSVSFWLRFSPDSKHLAYLAGQGSTGMRVLVRDGVETRYANLQLGLFSPDSRHLASVGLFGTNWLVLIDGKRLEPQVSLAAGERSFSPVSDLVFSPDSQHLAYLGRGEANWLVLLDGREIMNGERVMLSPVFSPDSRRLAFGIEQEGRSHLVYGGQSGKDYDQFLTRRAALEDGSQIIGFVFDDQGVIHAMALRGRELLRVEIGLVKNN